MRATTILLTEKQFGHLEKIRKDHGISFAGYIRLMLKMDMEGGMTTMRSEVSTKITTQKTIRREIVQQKVAPQWKSIQSEMKDVLEKRRQHVDEYITTSP